MLIFTDATDHNGWYGPNDDQTQYYAFAEAMTRGVLAPVYTTIGYDVLLLPFAAVTDFVLQAIPTVAAVQIALGLAAAVLLYRVGCEAMSRGAAAVGTALWLALALVLGPLFESSLGFWRSHAPTWVGLNIGTDYASSLLAIVVLALILRAKQGGIPSALLLGVAAGYAVLTKPSNVVLLASGLLALAVWRRWRAALITLAAAAVVFTPQLVLNQRLFGDPTSFAYDTEVAERLPANLEVLTGGSFSLGNLTRVFRTLAENLLGGPTLLVLAALALAVAFARLPIGRWLLVPPAVGYGLLIGSYFYADGPHFPRLIMPALPALCLAIGGAVLGGRGELRQPRRPARRALALSAAGLAAAAALAAWVAQAHPADERVLIGGAPVVAELEPEVRLSDGAVLLRWDEPDAPATLVYRVYRLSAPEPEAPRIRGFQWASLTPAATIDAPGTEARDRPPPGAWWYRVALAPSPSRGGLPPYDVVMAISPAVRVVVSP